MMEQLFFLCQLIITFIVTVIFYSLNPVVLFVVIFFLALFLLIIFLKILLLGILVFFIILLFIVFFSFIIFTTKYSSGLTIIELSYLIEDLARGSALNPRRLVHYHLMPHALSYKQRS